MRLNGLLVIRTIDSHAHLSHPPFDLCGDGDRPAFARGIAAEAHHEAFERVVWKRRLRAQDSRSFGQRLAHIGAKNRSPRLSDDRPVGRKRDARLELFGAGTAEQLDERVAQIGTDSEVRAIAEGGDVPCGGGLLNRLSRGAQRLREKKRGLPLEWRVTIEFGGRSDGWSEGATGVSIVITKLPTSVWPKRAVSRTRIARSGFRFG